MKRVHVLVEGQTEEAFVGRVVRPRLLLNDSAVVGVSTMIDDYGLPADVPGMATRPASALAGALHVEAAMEAYIGDPRFRAHLSLHEFESLLFTDPDLCGEYLGTPAVTRVMSDAIAQCGGARTGK